MSEPVVQVRGVADVPGDLRLLTSAEARRHERLVRTADREAYLAAHVLVRLVASELAGVAPERLVLAQQCPSCGGADHGRPSIAGLPDVHVSLSHARGVVAAVAAGGACGIDVEPYRGDGVPAGTLTAREQSWIARQPDPGAAFTRLWTRKEAWVKATGEGLDRAVDMDVLEADWLTGELLTDGYAAAWVVL
ncbi:4'-phosphopantetheinyl transferase family protein [Nocardioides sp. Iso805N]|uniref:4'-phosphopantetheinyl transferase family protein n=1 Tax=Nocardioides sp. Iso805N TaxID=1283287 RepID=UPI000379CFDF|nr:4'-phosphopantetheinyl transferase superfamily protein [Nocardioides sp. Iso805N]